MNPVQGIILLFTKYPVPGKAKTRLIPALGASGAAKLQRWMTRKSLATIYAYQVEHPVDYRVYYAGGSEEKMCKWLGSALKCTPQHPGNLGERMINALLEHTDRYRGYTPCGLRLPRHRREHL